MLLKLCLQRNIFGRGICRNKGFPTEFHSIGGYILGEKGYLMLWFNGAGYYSHLAADGTGTSSLCRCFLCCKDLLSCTQPILSFRRAAQTHEEKKMGWDFLFLLMPNQSLSSMVLVNTKVQINSGDIFRWQLFSFQSFHLVNSLRYMERKTNRNAAPTV